MRARYVTCQSISEQWEDSFLVALYKASPEIAKSPKWDSIRSYCLGGYTPADAVAKYLESRKEIAA